MGFGEYISGSAENKYVNMERARESWEYENNAEGETEEMIELYMKKGFVFFAYPFSPPHTPFLENSHLLDCDTVLAENVVSNAFGMGCAAGSRKKTPRPSSRQCPSRSIKNFSSTT